MPTVSVRINGDKYKCGIHKRENNDGTYRYITSLDRYKNLWFLDFHDGSYTDTHTNLGNAVDDLEQVIKNKVDVEENDRIEQTLDSTVENLVSNHDNIELIDE